MTKKKTIPLSQNGSDQGTLLYDEWIIPDVLKIVIDMIDIMKDMEIYQRQLMISRGIPQQAEAFTVDDPNINIAMDFYSHISDDRKRETMAVSLLKDHYERLAEEMQGMGFMLAATKFNTIDSMPKDYSDEWEDTNSLPGVAKLPNPVPDLRHPVEHRLKQILDILQDNPVAFAELQSRFNTIRITINQRMKLGRNALPGES